ILKNPGTTHLVDRKEGELIVERQLLLLDEVEDRDEDRDLDQTRRGERLVTAEREGGTRSQIANRVPDDPMGRGGERVEGPMEPRGVRTYRATGMRGGRLRLATRRCEAGRGNRRDPGGAPDQSSESWNCSARQVSTFSRSFEVGSYIARILMRSP